MGVAYMARNRERARTLGGRELSLGELRALRYVREHRRNPAPPEELARLDGDIRRMDGAQLIEDLDWLRSFNRKALVVLEKRGARLPYEERLGLTAWLERVERLRGEYRECFHLCHLLAAGDGGDQVLRDLNLAYLWLAVVSRPDYYRQLRYLSDDRKPQPLLRQAIEGLLAGALAEHLEDGRWFGPPRRLRDLPEEPVQRTRILSLYQDYLELHAVENAFNDFGRFETDELKNGPKIPNHGCLRQEEDPSAVLSDALAALGSLLEEHLGAR